MQFCRLALCYLSVICWLLTLCHCLPAACLHFINCLSAIFCLSLLFAYLVVYILLVVSIMFSNYIISISVVFLPPSALNTRGENFYHTLVTWSGGPYNFRWLSVLIVLVLWNKDFLKIFQWLSRLFADIVQRLRENTYRQCP